MTSRPVDRPVSPLCARIIEDMTVRSFSQKRPNDYIAVVRGFPPAAHPIPQQKRMCAGSSCTSGRAACNIAVSCGLRLPWPERGGASIARSGAEPWLVGKARDQRVEEAADLCG